MRSLPLLARTVLAAALVLLASACSVTVPEGRAPAVGTGYGFMLSTADYELW